MRWMLLGLALSLSACADNVGPDGASVGGPCVDEFDCGAGSYCLRRSEFPRGTCTTNCDMVDDCRGASTCVDLESGVCLLTCEEDEDCGREGYVCRERSIRGEAVRQRACMGS